jgi:hypothetical protein
MGVKKDIYLDVKDIIENLDVIEHFAVWNNQLDNEDREDAFNYPAVFFEFSDILWTPAAFRTINSNVEQQQAGGIAITLHVAFFYLEDETESFINQLDIVDSVYRAVAGLQGETYSPFQRESEVQDINHDGVIDWQVTFRSPQVIDAGNEDEDKIDATDGGANPIDIEIVPDLDIDNFHIRTGDGLP